MYLTDARLRRLQAAPEHAEGGQASPRPAAQLAQSLLHTSMAGRILLGCGVVVAAWSSCGCGSVSGYARDQFATAYSCPQGDVVVVRRADVPAHTFLLPPAPALEEVARDPERLRVWQTQRRQLEQDADRRTVYDVYGCGHEERYACMKVESYYGDDIECTPPPPPPPRALGERQDINAGVGDGG